MSNRLSSTRKTFASLGDDTTLTRFVKNKSTDSPKHPRKFQHRLDGIGVPAFVAQGRTKFPSRVLAVSDQRSVLLTSGHSNVKIGRDVRFKGLHRGYWIYYLSLEERKTCPSSCKNWQSCYGNNMPFAKRVKHDDPEFLPTLEKQIDLLCQKKYGVLLRLHQLGDFYSSQYVHFWRKMLDRHPNLAVYGYTAHAPDSTIGNVVNWMNEVYAKRWLIRFSNFDGKQLCAITIASEDAKPAGSFICPEQTGKTQCCATCGACWATTKNVAFLEH